jgi:hypothetical protein
VKDSTKIKGCVDLSQVLEEDVFKNNTSQK